MKKPGWKQVVGAQHHFDLMNIMKETGWSEAQIYSFIASEPHVWCQALRTPDIHDAISLIEVFVATDPNLDKSST